MTALAVLAIGVVLGAANAYRRHRGGRPVTEHAVYALYAVASHAWALAMAADKALATYRQELMAVKGILQRASSCSH